MFCDSENYDEGSGIPNVTNVSLINGGCDFLALRVTWSLLRLTLVSKVHAR